MVNKDKASQGADLQAVDSATINQITHQLSARRKQAKEPNFLQLTIFSRNHQLTDFTSFGWNQKKRHNENSRKSHSDRSNKQVLCDLPADSTGFLAAKQTAAVFSSSFFSSSFTFSESINTLLAKRIV
jgi:hypothetical protein